MTNMRMAMLTGLVLGTLVAGCSDDKSTPADSGVADAAAGSADTAVGSEAGASDATTTPDATAAGEAGAGATVVGTLTLPGDAAGKAYLVALFAKLPSAGGIPIATTTGLTTGSTALPYSLPGVPAGTYFILGFVDVDGSGGMSSTTGDYRGWYGHDVNGNPPAAPNAIVPTSGEVRFDFTLVVAQP